MVALATQANPWLFDGGFLSGSLGQDCVLAVLVWRFFEGEVFLRLVFRGFLEVCWQLPKQHS